MKARERLAGYCALSLDRDANSLFGAWSANRLLDCDKGEQSTQYQDLSPLLKSAVLITVTFEQSSWSTLRSVRTC